MASIIRTKTFIKYARIKLQEAESAIQEEELSKAIKLCKDCGINLIKALVNFVDGYDIERVLNNRSTLLKLLTDLTGDKKEAQSTCNDLLSLKEIKEDITPSRKESEQMFSKAGKLFTTIHSYCFPE